MRRLRDLGLLLLFLVLFSAFVFVAGSVVGPGIVSTGAVMLAGALLIGWLLLTQVERRPAADLGLSWRAQSAREVLLGLVLPVAALLLVTMVLLLFGYLRYEADSGSVGGWIIGCLQLLLILAVPAAAEEALFRGYPFQKLVAIMGPIAATLLASAGFAFVHRHNPGVNAFALTNIFLAGVLLSMAYLRTRSLWLPIALHTAWNWMIAGPLDLQVSGLELFDAPLYEPRSLGPEWVSGGSFGPEAGISGLIALLLITAATWMLTNKQTAEA